MTTLPRPAASSYARGVSALRAVTGLFDRIPWSVVALAARVFPAVIFWRSGRTKVDGWSISDSAIYLFRFEYRLPLIDPVLAAWLATVAEHVFPALLVIGLATRFSALALLGMTLVIQVFVYPDAWPTHGLWAACLLTVLARGPGVLSIDHLLARTVHPDGRPRP